MAAIAAEPQVEYKKKLFYRINEVSKITGLKPYVLRYWETEFPHLSPQKDDNDQRRYKQKDIDLILTIRQLLYEEKFTIAGAKQRISVEMSTGRHSSGAKSKPIVAAKRGSGKPKKAKSGLLSELSSIRGDLKDLLALLG